MEKNSSQIAVVVVPFRMSHLILLGMKSSANRNMIGVQTFRYHNDLDYCEPKFAEFDNGQILCNND